MEDEMLLDGAVVAAEFDDTLDIGVVGTSAGTLWYINWLERSSIRLASCHGSKVCDIRFPIKGALDKFDIIPNFFKKSLDFYTIRSVGMSIDCVLSFTF